MYDIEEPLVLALAIAADASATADKYGTDAAPRSSSEYRASRSSGSFDGPQRRKFTNPSSHQFPADVKQCYYHKL
ncbi:hypothetical protein GQ42DRAFT_164275, partial [Ramicandelaber brevisporus]